MSTPINHPHICQILQGLSAAGEQFGRIVDDAGLDDTMEPSDVSDVLQRVGIEDDEVRQLPGLNRALRRITPVDSRRRHCLLSVDSIQ